MSLLSFGVVTNTPTHHIPRYGVTAFLPLLTLIHGILLFLKVKDHHLLAHVFFACLCTLDLDRVYEFASSSLLFSQVFTAELFMRTQSDNLLMSFSNTLMERFLNIA